MHTHITSAVMYKRRTKELVKKLFDEDAKDEQKHFHKDMLQSGNMDNIKFIEGLKELNEYFMWFSLMVTKFSEVYLIAVASQSHCKDNFDSCLWREMSTNSPKSMIASKV